MTDWTQPWKIGDPPKNWRPPRKLEGPPQKIGDPPEQKSWHTPMKILPWPNFVAAGNDNRVDLPSPFVQVPLGQDKLSLYYMYFLCSGIGSIFDPARYFSRCCSRNNWPSSSRLRRWFHVARFDDVFHKQFLHLVSNPDNCVNLCHLHMQTHLRGATRVRKSLLGSVIV